MISFRNAMPIPLPRTISGNASMSASLRRLLPSGFAALSAAALLALTTAPSAHAQDVTDTSDRTFVEQDVQAPRITASGKDQTKARRLSLSMGRSVVVELPRSAKEVFIGDPTIANAVIRTARKMYIIAMQEGTTTIFVNDGEGRQIAAFDVNVAKERGNEIQALREVLKQALPNAVIEARSVGENIVLSGEVDSLLEAQRALDIASNLVGTGLVGGASAAGVSAAGGSGALLPTVTGKVINGLRVRGKDQVC
jgi:pilus assembly protein CpaC